jgi:hypothetical protein
VRIETLIRMGQQIAHNQAALPSQLAADRIARHLTSFWTRPMIAELVAYAAASPEDLDPDLIAALSRLRTDSSRR